MSEVKLTRGSDLAVRNSDPEFPKAVWYEGRLVNEAQHLDRIGRHLVVASVRQVQP